MRVRARKNRIAYASGLHRFASAGRTLGHVRAPDPQGGAESQQGRFPFPGDFGLLPALMAAGTLPERAMTERN